MKQFLWPLKLVNKIDSSNNFLWSFQRKYYTGSETTLLKFWLVLNKLTITIKPPKKPFGPRTIELFYGSNYGFKLKCSTTTLLSFFMAPVRHQSVQWSELLHYYYSVFSQVWWHNSQLNHSNWVPLTFKTILKWNLS